MMQHSPEQEEMRAFPGPLAKYVLTDLKKLPHFLDSISSSNILLSYNCKLQGLN